MAKSRARKVRSSIPAKPRPNSRSNGTHTTKRSIAKKPGSLAEQSPKLTPKKSSTSPKWNNQLDDTLVVAGFTHGFQLVRPSLGLIRNNLETSLVVTVLPSMVVILGSVLSEGLHSSRSKVMLGTLIGFVGLVWLIISSLVALCMEIRATHGRQPTITEVYRDGMPYIPRLIGSGILIGAIAAVGFILFIVPGIIALRRYFLAPYYIVDQNLGIREAMDKSAEQTKPVSSAVYGVIFTVALFSGLSVGLSYVYPPFGSVVGAILSLGYLYGPAYLYKEVQALQADDQLSLQK